MGFDWHMQVAAAGRAQTNTAPTPGDPLALGVAHAASLVPTTSLPATSMFALLTLLGYDESLSAAAGGPVISQERLYEYIGLQIRNHRDKRSFTQQDLADRIGLERTSITNIERGKQKLPLHVLFGICEALDVTPNDVLPHRNAVSERKPLEAAHLGAFRDMVPLGIKNLIEGGAT